PTKDRGVAAAAEKLHEAAAAADDYEIDKEKWVKEAADFFMKMCDHFWTGDDPKLDSEFLQKMGSRLRKMEDSDVDLEDLIAKELIPRIHEKKFLFCSFCNRFMLGSLDAVMHIASPEHLTRMTSEILPAFTLMLKMVEKSVQEMHRDESDIAKRERERCSSMSLEDRELRPTKEFIESLNRKFVNSESVMKSKVAQALNFVSACANDSEKVEFVIDQILIHIDDHKARCIQCKLIFDDETEYFRHLTTVFHMQKTGLFDVITIITNLHALNVLDRD
ncbi:hypothetical protein PMAYCL1PPCAC_00530, partial [Pristionchus mayeri]